MNYIFTLFLLMFCIPAFSQRAPEGTLKELNMDLPDETEETDLIEKGELQAEVAYLHTKFPEGAQPSIGQALLRYGLMEKLELRLLLEEGYARDKYMEETVQSTYPLAFSIKL